MRVRQRRHANSTFIVEPPGLRMSGRLRRGCGLTSTLSSIEVALLGPAMRFSPRVCGMGWRCCIAQIESKGINYDKVAKQKRAKSTGNQNEDAKGYTAEERGGTGDAGISCPELIYDRGGPHGGSDV